MTERERTTWEHQAAVEIISAALLQSSLSAVSGIVNTHFKHLSYSLTVSRRDVHENISDKNDSSNDDDYAKMTDDKVYL